MGSGSKQPRRCWLGCSECSPKRAAASGAEQPCPAAGTPSHSHCRPSVTQSSTLGGRPLGPMRCLGRTVRRVRDGRAGAAGDLFLSAPLRVVPDAGAERLQRCAAQQHRAEWPPRNGLTQDWAGGRRLGTADAGIRKGTLMRRPGHDSACFLRALRPPGCTPSHIACKSRRMFGAAPARSTRPRPPYRAPSCRGASGGVREVQTSDVRSATPAKAV